MLQFKSYALCGFANFGSIGLQISVLSSLAPQKAKLIPRMAFVAMLAGNITNFLNDKCA
jgi:CNT family concentrative nucleoside transporter